MISDLAIARLAATQSSTSVEAQVNAATLRLQVEAAHAEANQRAKVGLSATSPVDGLIGSLETTTHVDKLA